MRSDSSIGNQHSAVPPSWQPTVMMPPPAVVSSWPPVRSLAFRVPFTTWYSWRGSGVGIEADIVRVREQACGTVGDEPAIEAVRMAVRRLGRGTARQAWLTPRSCSWSAARWLHAMHATEGPRRSQSQTF